MKIKDIEKALKRCSEISICEAEGRQWIGTDEIVFPLTGIPRLTQEEAATILNIDEDDKKKFSVGEVAPDVFRCSFQDALVTDGEPGHFFRPISFDGEEHSPIQIEAGVIYVPTALLKPFYKLKQSFNIGVRSYGSGSIQEYQIIIKCGMFLEGIIFPRYITNPTFLNDLRELLTLSEATADNIFPRWREGFIPEN